MTLLDELERLRVDALAFARRVAAVRAGGRGVDRAGVVEIVLDGDGRPADVRLRPEWRGVIGVGGLPVAVREAWSAAVLDRLGAWAVAATDSGVSAGTPADDARPPCGVTAGGPPPAAPVQTGADGEVGGPALPAALVRTGADGGVGGLGLPAALVRTGADGGIGRATPSALVGKGAAQEQSERVHGRVAGQAAAAPMPDSTDWRVVVEISRGELVALRVDEGWARVADETEIGAAVRAALAEALGTGSVDGARVAVAAVDGGAANGGPDRAVRVGGNDVEVTYGAGW